MIKKIITLIRVKQWYKNLLVFLAIFFSGNILNQVFLFDSLKAFFSLSLIASSYYIINDLVDLKRDKLHPEKKFRPLASGKVRHSVAYLLLVVLLFLGLVLAFSLGQEFFILAVSLFVLSQIYSFFLKHIVFADVLTISSLFVIRALSGAYAIDVQVSPWLILCPFFLALFLVLGKRHGDLKLLKNKAGVTRDVLKTYTLELTNLLMIISTTLLIMSYALYSFLSSFNFLIYTIPFALFVIFRYFLLIQSGSEVSRKPHLVIGDKQMVVGILVWVLVVFGIIYI